MIFAILSFAISFLTEREFQAASQRPILVFEFSLSEGWHLRNVGRGAALNPLVFEGPSKDEWMPDGIRVPALGSGRSFHMKWLTYRNIDRLAVIYEDAEGRPYSSIADDDLTNVETGHFRSYPDKVIPYWSSKAQRER